MNFYISQHQHKAARFIEALSQKHTRVTGMREADFYMTDFTIQGLWGGNTQQWRNTVLVALLRNKPLFLFPHSARPNVPFDLQDKFCRCVDATFVFSEGHKQVLEIIGYPQPVEVVGWTYTKLHDFKPVTNKKKLKVLFAPIHPLGTSLPKDEQHINNHVYGLLIELVKMDVIGLTVRYLDDFEANGLYPSEYATLVHGAPDGSMMDAVNADVVVAAYTYAYSTVAIGKPLVMLGESLRPHNTPRGEKSQLIYGKKWDEYKDYMQFPYNADCYDTPESLLEVLWEAGTREPLEWKERFIGREFDSHYFLDTLESYLA